MQQLAAGKNPSSSVENVLVGFLAGEHLFDHDFSIEKNVINDALHCGIRIDTNQIPAAIRKAWLQMELAGLAKDNSSGRPTKAQRQEAKEAVEQRCEVEAATGKYRKMQQFPALWDLRNSTLYFAGSGATASGFCAELFERAHEVTLSRISSGTLAHRWATDAKRLDAYEDLTPSNFLPHQPQGEIAWNNPDRREPDFLGNEFLMWMWWHLEKVSDTFKVNGSEITAMLNKTLVLECPYGESGKETIAAESPVQLPEAMQAIRTGKLPRKAGMTLVRDGQQFDLVLSAESFALSGAKIHIDDDAKESYEASDRIDSIRAMCETVDNLFQHFCSRRMNTGWGQELDKIRNWLSSDLQAVRAPAA
jgi:hypothetical protein